MTAQNRQAYSKCLECGLVEHGIVGLMVTYKCECGAGPERVFLGRALRPPTATVPAEQDLS
jgi:hypothetical protein